jgi:hypothetical protein
MFRNRSHRSTLRVSRTIAQRCASRVCLNASRFGRDTGLMHTWAVPLYTSTSLGPLRGPRVQRYSGKLGMLGP